MNYLRQVQKGIDHIEGNLGEEINLADVSHVAGVSHWHFQRMFRALTGETLKSYIRSRRLANARVELIATEQSILQIAVGAGFDSQASFTRAFKKAFGVTPGGYRTLGDEHLFLKKVRIDEDYLRHINKNVSLNPEIQQLPLRHLVGLRTRFYSVDSERNNIAEKLPPLWEAFLPRLKEIESTIAGVCYGVIRQSEAGSDHLEYTAVIEVSERPSTLPNDMVYLEIPAATYATFLHQGDPLMIDHTVNYIYSTWLLQSGYRHTYGADYEVYDSDWRPDSEDSKMYYAIPIAKP